MGQHRQNRTKQGQSLHPGSNGVKEGNMGSNWEKSEQTGTKVSNRAKTPSFISQLLSLIPYPFSIFHHLLHIIPYPLSFRTDLKSAPIECSKKKILCNSFCTGADFKLKGGFVCLSVFVYQENFVRFGLMCRHETLWDINGLPPNLNLLALQNQTKPSQHRQLFIRQGFSFKLVLRAC